MLSGRRTVFQDGHQYLMRSAGMIWRLTGIAWASLDVLAGLLFAVAVAAAYVALRFVCGRTLSLLVAAVWAISPLHLSVLPHLRDYSKAPFFVLMVIAVGAVVQERRLIRLVALGAMFGAIEGVGFGMRTDVILNLLPFLFVLFAARPEGLFQNIAAKVACAAAAIVLFIAVALPALRPYEKSGKLWHVALLGLTTPFDGNLNVRPASYDFGYEYLDGYIEAVVTTQSARTHPNDAAVTFAMESYDPACREYYRRLAVIFPGDVITRIVGSALHVFNIPFLAAADRVPFGVTNPVLVWTEQRRADAMLWFEGTGALIVAALLILIGCRRLRDAVVVSALLVGWAAYPFLMFEGRHVFHLELLALGTVACAGVLGWRTLTALIRGRLAQDWSARVFRSVALVGVLFAAVAATLYAARTIQEPRAGALLASYRTAPVDPIATTVKALDPARVRLSADLFSAPVSNYGAQALMLMVTFDPDRCAGPSLDVTFRYDVTEPGLDFSRTVAVPLSPTSGKTFMFFPVYSLARRGVTASRFAGLEVPTSAVQCIGLSRTRDLDRAPLWLKATMTAAGVPAPLHQRLNLAAGLPPRVWGKMIRLWPRIADFG